MQNKYGSILSVEQEAIVRNVNLASNHGAIYKDLYGIKKVLSLLNERDDLKYLESNLECCAHDTKTNVKNGQEWFWVQ